jgi:hypothetical protein
MQNPTRTDVHNGVDIAGVNQNKAQDTVRLKILYHEVSPQNKKLPKDPVIDAQFASLKVQKLDCFKQLWEKGKAWC